VHDVTVIAVIAITGIVASATTAFYLVLAFPAVGADFLFFMSVIIFIITVGFSAYKFAGWFIPDNNNVGILSGHNDRGRRWCFLDDDPLLGRTLPENEWIGWFIWRVILSFLSVAFDVWAAIPIYVMVLLVASLDL